MKGKIILPVISIYVASVFSSCVPSRQFDEVKAARDKCELERADLKSKMENYLAEEKELNQKIEQLSEAIEQLSDDTTSMGLSMRRLSDSYDKLNNTYDQLLSKNEQLLKGKDEDNRKLMGQYQSTQDELIKKEDRLKIAEADLEKRKAETEQLSKELKIFEQELDSKQKRVRELEDILSRKDSTVKALKDKVADALSGFQNNGLSVNLKNGKVYVSLEERLLFESGSIVVDKKGEAALKDLARVLEKERDINVLIEGHTDNVPIKSSTIKDNWDLSALRATSIVRIITTQSKVDPKRLTAAGRGEFFPIDSANNPEARKKNRRTEIILSPKLDELFKILNDQ